MAHEQVSDLLAGELVGERPLGRVLAQVDELLQCCGGVVTMLLEPLHVTPVVAIFGMGHVGHELARILARHDLDLHLVDTHRRELGEHVDQLVGAASQRRSAQAVR